jgi:hypothetical protein
MNGPQCYRVLETKKVGQEIQKLVRFNIPTSVGYYTRKKILDEVLDLSGADAMVEVYWTRGSIIKKNPFKFDAILIYSSESSMEESKTEL